MSVHKLRRSGAYEIAFGISIDMFKVDVGVFFNVEDLISYAGKNFDITLDKDEFSATANAEAGAIFNSEGVPYFYVLFHSLNPPVGIIAHECVHVGVAICDSLGVPCDRGADETLAYMVDYLVQNICDTLLEHREKMNAS